MSKSIRRDCQILFLIYVFIVQTVAFSAPLFRGTTNGIHSSQTNAGVIPAVVTRRRPTLNTGVIEGSLRLLTGESFSISGGVTMTELFVPGTPSFIFNGGTRGAIVSDKGAATPAGHPVTQNGGDIIGNIHKQADPIPFPADIPTSVPNAGQIGSFKFDLRNTSFVPPPESLTERKSKNDKRGLKSKRKSSSRKRTK